MDVCYTTQNCALLIDTHVIETWISFFSLLLQSDRCFESINFFLFILYTVGIYTIENCRVDFH